MNDNSSYVLGLIALIMVSISCVFFVFYRAGGGRESRSKTVRYAGCLGKLLFAASVILLSVSVLNGFAKGEGFRENLKHYCRVGGSIGGRCTILESGALSCAQGAADGVPTLFGSGQYVCTDPVPACEAQVGDGTGPHYNAITNYYTSTDEIPCCACMPYGGCCGQKK